MAKHPTRGCTSGAELRQPADPSIKVLFMKQVDRRGACWLWCGKKIAEYGAFKAAGIRGYAHRVSYAIHCGTVPARAIVAHTCDNPLCVNPDHLLLTTQSQNMRDACARGRVKVAPRGESNHNARLSDKEVELAVKLCREGHTQDSVARLFGIRQGTVNMYVNGKRRSHEPTDRKTPERPKGDTGERDVILNALTIGLHHLGIGQKARIEIRHFVETALTKASNPTFQHSSLYPNEKDVVKE